MTTKRKKPTKPKGEIWWAVSKKPYGKIKHVMKTRLHAVHGAMGIGGGYVRQVLVTDIKNRGKK